MAAFEPLPAIFPGHLAPPSSRAPTASANSSCAAGDSYCCVTA